MRALRVVHLVPDLALGGAETALVRLVEGLDRARFASLVVTLRDGGSLVARAEAAGARVASLGMRTRLPSPMTVARLRAVLRAFAPDVLQGWMYHGNLAAWLGARLLPEPPAVAWNVRQSLASDAHLHERATTRLAIRANVVLCRQVERIVFNAHSSAAQHAALGFDASRGEVVPNGFDAARFRPDPAARAALRAELGLPGNALLAGMVARVHPVKRHDLFLAAVAAATQGGLDVHGVVAGSGASPASAEIARLVAASGASGRIHLLGERTDVERILPALDVLVSASGWAEGFPNVVGEAMACGVPCLVTDTGDCASIVGDAGVVVRPGDGAQLATALVALLRRPAEERAQMGARGRARILASFTLERCVARYAELYASLAGAAGAAAAGHTPAA